MVARPHDTRRTIKEVFMRIRSGALTILLAIPCALSAQRIRLPRVGRRPTPPPAALPPEVPEVNRALALQRSRWSAEGYGMVTSIQVPQPGNSVSTYATLGTGTHADYRYTDHWSASVDMTLASMNSPAILGTAEVGTRFAPLALDADVRPFFDVRAAYIYMYDLYSQPLVIAGNNTTTPLYAEQSRYSRGGGGIVGTGFEYTLTNSLSLSTELLAFRNHLTTYRTSGPGTVPTGSGFNMTSYRYVLGFKYNRAHNLAHLADRK
jgi:hypothetical protein